MIRALPAGPADGERTQYAEAKNVAVDAVWGLIMVTVTASGIPEAIVAAILVAVIGKVMLRFTSHS